MMTLYISVDLRPSAFSSTSKFKIYAHLDHVSLLAAFGADVSPRLSSVLLWVDGGRWDAARASAA